MFKGGDHLCCSLWNAIVTIADTISNSQRSLYSATSYRESRRYFYTNGPSYQDKKKLEIGNDQIYSLFQEPHIGHVFPTIRSHISIYWCVEPSIKENWMERWYMVFDEDPHKIRDMPLYFL